MADKIPPSSPAYLVYGCDDAQHGTVSDPENDPPNSYEEVASEEEHNDADSSNDGNSSNTDTVESNDSPTTSVTINSSSSRPNDHALNEGFAQDLLNVLNACTRTQYQQTRFSAQMNEYKFDNAMNSYLDVGGDINVARLYDSDRESSERYPASPRRGREMRDASVMTESWTIAEESEDEDECDQSKISKTN